MQLYDKEEGEYAAQEARWGCEPVIQHCSVAATRAPSLYTVCQLEDARGCCHTGVIQTLPELRQ